MKKLDIYLGDLVHNSVAKGPFDIPLNIGYVAAYVKKYFDKDINIKLFKYPLQMIDAIKENSPHILGLGNYVWNTDLNYKIIEFSKAHLENLIAVLGGPNFPINEDEQQAYLAKRPLIDFYVTNQGEPGFLNLIERILGTPGGMEKMRDTPINGCVFLGGEGEGLVVGKETQEFVSLDEIPSPYLSGSFDKFFSDNLIPIIETDRGCPYTCTFCAWGKTANSKPRQFSISRVKAELDYIAKHVKYTNFLFIANANFGIFERDKNIAEYIKQHSIDSGYPRKIYACWAKNTSKRIIDIAEVLGDMVEITMSFQSLNTNVLKNIKRSNINISTFSQIKAYFAKKGVPSSSELILGLPGETKESHLDALRTLIDLDAGVIVCFNCRTLGGTLLDTRQQREKYGIKTKYRLYDIGFGKYGNIVSIEADEIVRSTNTLSEEDILFFRSLHWLVQFLWSYKYYIDLLKYLQLERIHPIDFILRFILDRKNAPVAVRELLSSFEEKSKSEWFDSPEELSRHYSDTENFNMIIKGGFAKLNYEYMFRVLCESRNEFDIHLANTAKKMLDERHQGEAKETAQNIIDNLIRFMRSAYINFDDNLDFEREKNSKFDYDIIKWEKDAYNGALADYYKPDGISYLFYIPDEQYDALINNLRQFRHEDRNVTLRKMSEYMRKTDLFYKVSLEKDHYCKINNKN